MWKIGRMVFSMVVIVAVAVACEGPAGTDGPQGPSGPMGPVGPAGEDGSVIYAGVGQADNSMGAEGDYYLNQDTGELYGPKDENGWGNPIIVLMGEDGRDGADGQDGVDGQDGADGQDGEDGSVIHAGDGPPADDLGTEGDYYFDKSSGEFYGPKNASGWGTPTDLSGEDGQDGTDGQDGVDGEDGSRIYSGSGAPDASLGVVGDYYLDKSSYDLYGPKTSKGWGGPLNLKGADGSDNVTRYIYPNSIDFTSTYNKSFSLNAIGINSGEDLAKHIFLVYFKYEDWSFEGTIYYQLPGYGYNEDTFYATYHYWSESLGQANLTIIRQDGPGEVYNELEIVRIEAGNYDYPSYKVAEQHTIPDHLDTSDYEAVAGYYGFYRE